MTLLQIKKLFLCLQEEILSSPNPSTIIDSEMQELRKVEPKPVVPMTLTKIAPKGISTSKAVPGQIVVIQGPGGSTQQIRIASATNTQSPNGPIQLIKTADGKYLRISATKKPNSATSSTQAKPPAQRIIAKNSAGQSITSNTVSTATTANASPTAGVKRTFTVAQAQQMGIISSAKLKELVSQATAQKQAKLKAPPSPITSVTSKPTTSTSKVVAQKVIIQTSSGEQKQVSLPPNLIKLAQSGQIKAVNVAGKGIQYVRVMGTNSAANTTSTASIKSIPTAATKLVPVASKVFVPSKAALNQNQKFSLIQTPKQMTIGSTVVKSNVKNDAKHKKNEISLQFNLVFFQTSQEPSRTIVPVKKLFATSNLVQPSTSKDAIQVKEEVRSWLFRHLNI